MLTLFARFAVLAFALMPSIAVACDQPVCLTNPDELRFSNLIDFDDAPAANDLGSCFDSGLVRDGAVFRERFAGQPRRAFGRWDLIEGATFAPCTVFDGGPAQPLSAKRLPRRTVPRGDVAMIDNLVLDPFKEDGLACHTRRITPDIAGILRLSNDPQGVALDNLRFESSGTIS